MENEQQIKKGAFHIARKLFDSEIWNEKPMSWNLIWFYILGNVNHKQRGKFDRGEGFFYWTEIIANKRIGKEVTLDMVKKALAYFRRTRMISSRRSTRGTRIKVLNYNIYQSLDTYVSTSQSTREALEKHPDTQELKNDKNIIQGGQINKLIELFSEVNPMYKDFFKNTTERKALEDLIEQITYDKLEATIRKLPDIIKQPYAPKVTKPTELRRDLGKLIAFSKQKRSETIKRTTPNYVL